MDNNNKHLDEDYLDDLMNDLMEDDKEKNTSVVKEVYSSQTYKDEKELSVTQRILSGNTENSAPPKRSGLLSKIGVTASKGDNEDIIIKDSPLIKKNTQNTKEVLSTNEEDLYDKNSASLKSRFNEDEAPKVQVNSLIERMRKRNQKSAEPSKVSAPIENKHSPSEDSFVENVMEDEDRLEEIEIEEEEEKQLIIDSAPDIDSDEDSFDDMLNILKEEDDEKILDKSVEVPLETPEMSQVKVTADGRTLDDMLIGLRSGSQSIIQKVTKVRNQEEIQEVGGIKFSDDRYLKHKKKIDRETKENEEKVKLSNSFLQRNASYTEQEKIIMKNLGLNNKQLSNIMGSKKMSKKEKERLLSLGRYGAEKHFKGRKYRTTVGDTAMLEFLAKFKYANTRILRWLSNEPQGRTWRKLNRLKNSGLVEDKAIIGIPNLWGATPSGIAVSGYALNPGLRPMPKINTIASDMGVNYIAACLWFNSVNVLNLEDFPAENRVIALQKDGRDRVRGEMLVSELEIRSSLGKEINPSSTTMKTLGDERLYDVISSNVRQSFEEWEYNEKVGESPEFSLGNEYMWVLYPTSQLTLSYHVPDLVVKRDRGPNGEPKSIAIEVERYEKKNNKYEKIMLAYKLDEHLYEKVVWLTPNAKVARALQNAAENVGFDRYSILPIITEDGVYDKQDIWMI